MLLYYIEFINDHNDVSSMFLAKSYKDDKDTAWWFQGPH